MTIRRTGHPLYTTVEGVTIADVGETHTGDVTDPTPLDFTGAAVIDVTQTPYNAAGDGATDDAAAINAAIVAANAIGEDFRGLAGGAVVYLPAGTYLCEDPILLRSKVSLRGESSASTVLLQKAGNTGGLLRTATNYDNEWAVSDLRFDGNRANQVADSNCVDLLRGGDVTKSPSYIVTSPTTIGGDFLRFERCVISNVRGDYGLRIGAAILGVAPYGYSQVHIDHVFVFNCSGRGIQMDAPDNEMSNIQVGVCGKECAVLTGANNRVVNFKAYGGNQLQAAEVPSVEVGGGFQMVSNLEIQEGYGDGLRVTASDSHIDVLVQGVTRYGVHFHEGQNTVVEATVQSFNSYAPTNLGRINGVSQVRSNKLRIAGRNWSGDRPIAGVLDHNDIVVNRGVEQPRFDLIEATGDLLTSGDGVAAGKDCISRLAKLVGATTTTKRNLTGGVYGAVAGAANSFALTKVNGQALPRSQRGLPFLSRSALVVLDSPVNDVIAYGAGAAEQNAVKHGIRSVISRYRSTSVFKVDDPDLTFTGGWGADSANSEYPDGLLKAAGGNGDYVELDMPADWLGGTGVLNVVLNNQGAVWNVTTDGNAAGSLDARALAITGNAGTGTLRFPIPSGTSTVRVTVASYVGAAIFSSFALEVPAGNEGYTKQYPYEMSTSTTPPLVVVLSQPVPPTPTSPSELSIITFNNLAAAVVAEYASNMVAFVDVNDVLGRQARYFQGASDLRPNEAGHVRIAAQMYGVIRAAGVEARDLVALAA